MSGMFQADFLGQIPFGFQSDALGLSQRAQFQSMIKKTRTSYAAMPISRINFYSSFDKNNRI